MKAIEAINEKQLKNVPELRPGDTVKVHTKIIEGNKERIQVFEGVVIKVKGSGVGQTFTVRKISYGVGVERTFLTHSPKLAKIQIVRRSKVRRAYLTYLRALRGKAAKLQDQKFDALAVNVKEEELKPEDLAPAAPENEEPTDAELTELNADEDAKGGEVSDEQLANEENAEATVDAGDAESELGAEDQEIEVVETEEGLDNSQDEETRGTELGEGREQKEHDEQA